MRFNEDENGRVIITKGKRAIDLMKKGYQFKPRQDGDYMLMKREGKKRRYDMQILDLEGDEYQQFVIAGIRFGQFKIDEKRGEVYHDGSGEILSDNLKFSRLKDELNHGTFQKRTGMNGNGKK